MSALVPGQVNGERRAATFLGHTLDAPAMHLREVLGDAQAQTHPALAKLEVARGVVLGAKRGEEQVKDLAAIFLERNKLTSVPEEIRLLVNRTTRPDLFDRQHPSLLSNHGPSRSLGWSESAISIK